MTPINLEDVESYIIKDIEKSEDISFRIATKQWIRNIFAELRAREAVKENAEAVAEAEYFEEQTRAGEEAREAGPGS